MDISGASKKKRKFSESYYASMVMAGAQSSVLRQITLVSSVNRTCTVSLLVLEMRYNRSGCLDTLWHVGQHALSADDVPAPIH
jgi:hypothetical protein